MIWGEATAIADDVRMNPRQLQINDETAADLERSTIKVSVTAVRKPSSAMVFS